MDILSGNSYDGIYHRYESYDMEIPNANNLEWHISLSDSLNISAVTISLSYIIKFLTFGQIF